MGRGNTTASLILGDIHEYTTGDNNLTSTTGTNLNSTLDMADKDQPYYDLYLDAQFVTGLICYPLICFPGLLGNVLILIVLSVKPMQTSTNVYLSALAVSDIIKLLNDILYFFTVLLSRVHPPTGNRAFGYLYPYAHFFFNMSVCVSSWLIVCVAVERYLLVCHPARAKGIVSIPRARLLSVIFFLIMTCVAIPSAFRYKTVNVVKLDDTGRNVTELDVELTELWQETEFVVPYTWLQSLLRSIIPLFILVFMNAFIINALRKTRANKKNAARHRITLMLIIVILFFLLCIIPDAVMSAFFQVGYTESQDFLVKAVREVTDMLLAVNAALNFLLYIVFNKIFRDQFLQLFCPRCWRTDNSESPAKKTVANGKAKGKSKMPNKGGKNTYQKLELVQSRTVKGTEGSSSELVVISGAEEKTSTTTVL